VQKVNNCVVNVMVDTFFSLHILNLGTISFLVESVCFQKVRPIVLATET
jgi:hypothetical protein